MKLFIMPEFKSYEITDNSLVFLSDFVEKLKKINDEKVVILHDYNLSLDSRPFYDEFLKPLVDSADRATLKVLIKAGGGNLYSLSALNNVEYLDERIVTIDGLSNKLFFSDSDNEFLPNTIKISYGKNSAAIINDHQIEQSTLENSAKRDCDTKKGIIFLDIKDNQVVRSKIIENEEAIKYYLFTKESNGDLYNSKTFGKITLEEIEKINNEHNCKIYIDLFDLASTNIDIEGVVVSEKEQEESDEEMLSEKELLNYIESKLSKESYEYFLKYYNKEKENEWFSKRVLYKLRA